MTFRTNVDVQAEADAAGRRAQEARCVDDIFKQYPTIIRNQANANVIISDLKHFISDDTGNDPPTLAWFELLLAANPSYLSRLSVTTEELRKKALIDMIIEALRTGGSKRSEWDLAQERKRLNVQHSVQMLEDRLADIQNKQRLAKMTVPQIQKEIAESRPQPAGRVVLPVEFTVRSIKSMGVDALKNLIRTYGTAAVNDRLFGRS